VRSLGFHTLDCGYDGHGVRIYDQGSGPPIVVIPGVQGRSEWFTPTLDALKSTCRTISFTLAGDIGSGRKLDPALGFENYLRQLDEVFARTRLARASVCGISFGGLIAVRYAALRPDRVTSLVIASSPGPGWKPDQVQAAYIANPWRKALTFVATSPGRVWPEVRGACGPAGGLNFLARQGVRAAIAPMTPSLMAARILESQAIDFSLDCAAVQAPTLVISGEPHLDRIVPVESTRKYAEMIRGAKYVMLRSGARSSQNS
jgi:pimeloyl-ACP methyl ester carboxylesterase